MNPCVVTIKEKLDSMPMDEFELLLEGCADKSKGKTSEHAEIISQLEHQMKVQPEEAIPNLTNAKYSSSLQSLSLVHNKERGKNHHKVPVLTAGINSRPGDLYQQSPYSTSCCTPATAKPAVVFPLTSNTTSTNNLPAQYYFNCTQDVCQLPSSQGRSQGFDGEYGNNHESHVIKQSHLVYDVSEESAETRNKQDLSLKDTYNSVCSVTSPNTSQSILGPSNDRYSNDLSSDHFKLRSPISALASSALTSPPLVQQTGQTLSNLGFTNSHSQSLHGYQSPNSGLTTSPPSSSFSKSISDGSKKLGKKSKANKIQLRENIINPKDIPGYRGDKNVDELVKFVEGTPGGKRGNKKKERENRGKNGNEPLVKSMSLDDDNLSLAAKKTGDRSNRVSSLKETSLRSERGRVEKDITEKESVKGALSAVPGSKKSPEASENQRECEREDSKSPVRTQAEPNFTVVIRKRKNKTACTTSPTGSTVGKESDSRKENRRSRSRGERRKSVGSVPGSDQSEGSDDGSVRSLPAGECTKRENIPKSCASSGGTPQTSYADIARLTKDEENKKELSQALEDYPSLHGSDNSDGSDYGSDRSVPVGDITPKDVIQKSCSSNGGTPLTSYADIARLASHEEKKEDKKEQPTEDFPELSSTVSTASHESSVELMPSSPKSDSSASTVKYASSDSAFPQLAVSSAPKTTSQGPTNVKTMSTVVSVSSTSGTTKGANGSNTPVPTTSCAVSRAPTPTLKAQLSSTSPASTTVPCSSINSVINSVGGGSVTSNLTKAAGPPTTRVLNSQPTTLSNSEQVVDFGAAGVKFKPAVCSDEKNIPTDFSAVINGHLSSSDRMARKSDISGAKTGKSAFSVTVPQQNITDSGMGLCTEAVVFCGENFKEPPQLPSKDLEFEFGFDVNEALVDMNVKVPPDSPTVMKSTSNKKHAKNKVFPTPSKDPTRMHQHPSNHRHYQGGREEMHRHNQEKNNPQIVTDASESRDSKKPQTTTISQDSKVPRPEVLPGKPESRGASSNLDRQQSSNNIKQHKNLRKSAQADQTVSYEGVQVVAAQLPQSSLNESYSNSAIINYSPTSMSPSIPVHTGIPPAVNMFGMPAGYIPASTTYPTHFPGHLSAAGVVQLPTSHNAYECPPGQYVPTVYSRTPSAPVASSSCSDDHNFNPNSAALLSQNPVAAPVTSECPLNASAPAGNVHATGRQSQTGVPAPGGYYKVPDACNPPHTDSESARNVSQTVDFNNVQGYYANKVVFDRPVNLSPYYLTPDPSVYTNANMEDLRSYLRGRTQACERLQGDEKSRILQIT